MNKIIFFLLIAAIIIKSKTEKASIDYYYWRDYIGKIPEDAISAGKNAAGETVYVGQAYRQNCMVPVEIYSGKKEVSIPLYGTATKSSTGIRILCGDAVNFKWIPVNATEFHAKMIHYSPVIGGFAQNIGVYNTGRAFFGTGIKIGYVFLYRPAANLYLPHDGKEYEATAFEVLVVDPQL